ncbi:hypothetical protein LCGC14_1635350 [marine sediment metagenome]|uniref:Uncharacterized protein n=1 Tax=marine sediment metagenome TaxID=412755 RepID=A0A0F9I1M2_9ZZZZ
MAVIKCPKCGKVISLRFPYHKCIGVNKEGLDMKVIHDDELGGLMMIPLMCDWRISETCQIADCSERTNTIVCFNADESPTGKPVHVGICEKHHIQSKKERKFNFTVNI